MSLVLINFTSCLIEKRSSNFVQTTNKTETFEKELEVFFKRMFDTNYSDPFNCKVGERLISGIAGLMDFCPFDRCMVCIESFKSFIDCFPIAMMAIIGLLHKNYMLYPSLD